MVTRGMSFLRVFALLHVFEFTILSSRGAPGTLHHHWKTYLTKRSFSCWHKQQQNSAFCTHRTQNTLLLLVNRIWLNSPVHVVVSPLCGFLGMHPSGNACAFMPANRDRMLPVIRIFRIYMIALPHIWQNCITKLGILKKRKKNPAPFIQRGRVGIQK